MRRPYILALLFILCALAGRAVFFTQPVNSDTAIFVYMGKLVSEGGRIGVDLIDNKLPSVGLLMSAPYRLMGSHWWGYTLLGLVLMTLAPFLLARSAARTLGRHAFIPVGVAAALWLNFPPMVYGQLQLETIQVFFSILSACAALELLKRWDWRDAFVVGLCAGMGMWAKPTAGAIVPAVVAAVLFGTGWPWKHRLLATFWIGLGGLLPLVTCAWLLMITGMLEPMPAILAQLREYSSHSTAKWVDAVKPLTVLAVLMFPVVVWGYVFRSKNPLPGREGVGGGASFRSKSRDVDAKALREEAVKGFTNDTSTTEPQGSPPTLPSPSRGEEKHSAPASTFGDQSRKLAPPLTPSLPGRGVWLFVLGWLLMETVGVVMQRRMYAYHFLPMGAPAALMLGLFVRRLRLVSLGFALGPVALLCVIWTGQILEWPDRAARMTSVIDYLNEHGRPGAKVWMDDYPRLMVETNFQPGSRLPLTFLFGNSDTAPIHFGNILMEDLRANQPEWVVLYHDVDKYIDFYHHHMVEIAEFPQRGRNFGKAWHEIDGYVRANYMIEKQIDGMNVFRRAEPIANIHE